MREKPKKATERVFGGDALRLCAWNSRGMSAAVPYLRQLVQNFDILFISEHWLHHNRLGKLNDISVDVDWFARASRFSGSEHYGSSRGQGGVAVIWGKNLSGVTPLTQIHHDRICGIKMQTKDGAILNFLCVYLPAKGSNENYGEVLDELGAVIESMEEGSYTFVCGDLNADIGAMGGKRSDIKPGKEGKLLAGFISEYSFVAANLSDMATGPLNTFDNDMGNSCIDYILVPTELWPKVTSCSCMSNDPLNTSDHSPVSAVFMVKGAKKLTIDVKRKPNLKWGKLDAEQMATRYTVPVGHELESLYNNVSCIEPTPKALDNLITEVVAILRAGESGIPKATYKKHLKPFWSEDLTRLKCIKIRAYKEWVKAGRPRDTENELYIIYKQTKKDFCKKLRSMSKSYDEEKVREVIKSAEVDNISFWRILKNERAEHKVKVPAINDEHDKTIYDLDGILNVWHKYFSELCTPKKSASYDANHFKTITEEVRGYTLMNDTDQFTINEFSQDEVAKGLRKLKSNKTPGYDLITKEHLVHAGVPMERILTLMFRWILYLEYIPTNLKTGIQVPLHKGKNTSTLDTKNFRGITLLTSFNKLFEAILWGRMSTWWDESQVVSRLQGACRKGVSCIHTALLLQETVAAGLETYSKMFVSYFDVARAFDSVWIDGLFSRLYALGIRGKTWRLLYKTYMGFSCSVRIQDKVSKPYVMQCGIHQGGYLSLLKYIAFINTLIVELEKSELCSTVCGLKLSPLGYADDIASASTSKHKVDRVLDLVYSHSRKWRYDFNAKKSAILVYGESAQESKTNSKYREFKLGPDKVAEKESYDHVGLKCCVRKSSVERTKDKVQKGRKALNAASGIGLKRGGVSMKACSLLFWSLIVPMVTFASELWILKDEDIEVLENFQKYAGRKVQRFSTCTPNETSFVALGWMRLENFILVKKMLFVRTILVLKQSSPYRQLFIRRAYSFFQNIKAGIENKYDSPIYDLLRTVIMFDMVNVVMNFTAGTHLYEKGTWKKMVWQKAWCIGDEDWRFRITYFKNTNLLAHTMGNVRYISWWQLSDKKPELMRYCEDLAKVVCKTSLLKDDDPRLKHALPTNRMCQVCDGFNIENARHVFIHCDYVNDERQEMFRDIEAIPNDTGRTIMANSVDILHTLLGKPSSYVSREQNMLFWEIVVKHMSGIYRKVVNERNGIG